MNYKEADARLQGRNALSRKVENHTYLNRGQNCIHLKLHDTNVITWYADGRTELNSGGYRTVTTKARINDYLQSGFGLYQERGQWYIGKYSDGKHERLGIFEDGMVIHPDGHIDGMTPLKEASKALALRKRVNKFAESYAQAFGKGKVPAPGNGDCLYCNVNLKSQTGQPLGETIKDKGHLMAHLDESYFVPSILARAMTETPTSIAFKMSVVAKWQGQPEQAFFKPDDKWFLSQVKRAVSKYMLRQLGQAA